MPIVIYKKEGMAVRSLPLCFIILAQTKEDVRPAIGWRKK